MGLPLDLIASKTKKISNFLKDVIAAGIPDDHPDIEFLRSVRTLTISVILVVLIAIPFVIRYFLLGIPSMAFLLIAAGFLALVDIWFVRRSLSSFKICAHIGVCLLLIVMLYSNIVNGGFHDPSFSLLVVVPLFAGFVLGFQGLFLYTLILIFLTFLFYFFAISGIEIPNLIPEDEVTYHRLWIYLAVVMICVSICFGFLFQRRMTENSLIDAKEKAEESDELKANFLANMSHEIRTPMNGVLGMAELLSEMELSEKQRQYVSTIQRSGRTLLVIMNDILDFSKMQAHELTLVSKEFDLLALLEDTANTYKLRHKKDVQFRTKFDPNLPRNVLGDPVRLHQVMTNLLSNAFKFTALGEVVFTVSLLKKDDRQVTVHISISDSGIGIPEKHLQDLFKPFVQLQPENHFTTGGTGLGLAICERIIEQMGSSIHVDSIEGRGSMFYFDLILKLLPEDNASLEPVLPTKTNKDQVITVLVVEDNPVNQLICSEMLVGLGVKYMLAHNGEEAISIYSKLHDRIDLVLMDCEMPVMDGYEAARKIRELETSHDLSPVFICALTAQTSPRAKQASLDSGMNEYMEKPMNIRDLRWVLGQVQ